MFRARGKESGRARDIVRKSGFRPGEPLDAIAGGVPILTLPPASSGPIAAGTYFHPNDLSDYVTLWDLSFGTQVELSAVVSAASDEVSLYAVWGTTHAQVTGGTWEYLTDGLSLPAAGVYKSPWMDIPEDALEAEEIYIATVIEAEGAVTTLDFGICEVKMRLEVEEP
jgi:hypothetical protein